jgi:dephospho-CoA kinase
MKILLTGMSGTGKSSIIEALRRRGFHAVDTDYDNYCLEQNGERFWNEPKMQELLTSQLEPLFVADCEANQGKFYPLFNRVVLLSAPKETILERVRTRINNPYGKTPEQEAEILANLEEIEPRLRTGCDLEINTASFSVEEIVRQLETLLVTHR